MLNVYSCLEYVLWKPFFCRISEHFTAGFELTEFIYLCYDWCPLRSPKGLVVNALPCWHVLFPIDCGDISDTSIFLLCSS